MLPVVRLSLIAQISSIRLHDISTSAVQKQLFADAF